MKLLSKALIAASLLSPVPALAQSSPNWMPGQTVPSSQLKSAFVNKLDQANGNVLIPGTNFGAAAVTRNGSNQTWLSQTNPAMNFFDTFSSWEVLPKNGGIGVVGFSRASDNTTAFPGSIGGAYGCHSDNLNPVLGCWGLYITTWRDPVTGNAIGIEIDPSNNGELVPVHAYGLGGNGITSALWLAAGGEGTSQPGATPGTVSLAIGILGHETKYTEGIVFSANAFASDDGVTAGQTARAIELAKGHSLTWTSDGSDADRGHLRGDANGASGGIVFANGGIDFNDSVGDSIGFRIATPANAENRLSFNPGLVGVAPNFAVTSNDSEANIGLNVDMLGNGPMTVIGVGGLRVNTNFGSAPAAAASGTTLQTSGIAGQANLILVDGFANSSQFIGRRADGNVAAPSALLANELITTFGGIGFGSSAYSSTAGRINIIAAENWSGSANGTYIDFFTTPLGTITDTQHMRLDSDGDLMIGTTTNDGVSNLQVSGQAQASYFKTGAGALTANTGAIALSRMGSSGVAPGAAGGKIELVCGTTSGTVKLQIYGGTNATPVTIIDNVGSGQAGC